MGLAKKIIPLVDKLEILSLKIKVHFFSIQTLLNHLDRDDGGHQQTIEMLKRLDIGDEEARQMLAKNPTRTLASALSCLRRHSDDRRSILEVFDEMIPELRTYVESALAKFRLRIVR